MAVGIEVLEGFTLKFAFSPENYGGVIVLIINSNYSCLQLYCSTCLLQNVALKVGPSRSLSAAFRPPPPPFVRAKSDMKNSMEAKVSCSEFQQLPCFGPTPKQVWSILYREPANYLVTCML